MPFKPLKNKLEISAMDSIYKAIDKFEALGLTTEELFQAMSKIESKFNVTKK